MIGVSARHDEREVVEEFFQLFKTPWEFASAGSRYDVLLVTSEETAEDVTGELIVRYDSRPSALDVPHHITAQTRNPDIATIAGARVPLYQRYATLEGEDVRATAGNCVFFGYDLFSEVRFLLSQGQPPARAHYPTLDLHISLLRKTILNHRIPLLEIPPMPAGSPFWGCLTHDIDFLSLRQHRFDHTMLGFLYRATWGSFADFIAGRRTFRELCENLYGAAKLPLVLAGLSHDYWLPFPEYLKVENGRPSTFFIIPFKREAGIPSDGKDHSRRATAYDIGDLGEWPSTLAAQGCELALHGLNAWSSSEHAHKEALRFQGVASRRPAGVRMHWLYFAENSPAVLDEANFDYDSTSGYNDAVGYRAGTGQVFKPLNSLRMLELPTHIQDTALFYPGRMHLREPEAWELCERMIENAEEHAGVLTLLWHDRSLVPERLWGRFYARLLAALDKSQVCWGTAETVTRWFRGRRAITFCSSIDRGDSIDVVLDNVPQHASPDYLLRLSCLLPDRTVEVLEKPLQGRSRLNVRRPPALHPDREHTSRQCPPPALAVH